MILAARRKMEAQVAAEGKGVSGGLGSGGGATMGFGGQSELGIGAAPAVKPAGL